MKGNTTAVATKYTNTKTAFLQMDFMIKDCQ